MIDQRIGKAEAAGEEIEVAALGAAVRLDRQARGGIEFDLLLFRPRRRNDAVEIDGIGKFVLEERCGFANETGDA